MKLNILSDLHLSKGDLPLPGEGADLVILAGDIALAAGTNVRVLERDTALIDGVRFLGATLWTDFLAAGEGEAREAAMHEAQRFMRDFGVVRAWVHLVGVDRQFVL